MNPSVSAPSTDPDRRLVETVTYLASLASSPQVIEPLLDIVRRVTAKLQFGEQLDPGDRKQLEHVRFQLQNHLLHQDPVRQFTPEDLQAKLAERFGGRGQSPLRRRTLREVGYIFSLALISFFVGLGLAGALPATHRTIIGTMLALITMYIGVTWLFWSGLRTFSPRLRSAYYLICLGYLIAGITSITTPISTLNPGQDAGLLRYGIVFPIVVVSNFLIYSGTRIFAQTLGITSWAASRWSILALAAIAGISIALVPHISVEPSEAWLDINTAAAMATAVISGGTAWLAYRISRLTTAMYARAMRWFSITSGLVTVGMTQAAIGLLIIGSQPTHPHSVYITILFTVDAVLMIVSAYLFKRSSGSS